MTIADKTVLVTGANRGIGQALVTEALARGAKRVYAGTRQPLAHPGGRVTPLTLDVTDAAQIQAAADQVGSLDLLINNAGLALFDDLSDRAVLEQHLAVNLFGPYGVIQAFLPLLTRSGGAIVNNVSTMAVAPLPLTPAYAISKAAAFNLTQSLRALLAGRGVRVHAVLTGPTDTDMTRGFDIPKASPESVARAIFDGMERRGGGHLSRSRVAVPGRQLAQRGGQGARARERGVRRGRARCGVRRPDAMTDHKVVNRAEWQAARDELLDREKEHTRMTDELARQRRELPWVAIEKDYRFDTGGGTRTLAGLFGGRSQLLIYHFMFGPSYQAGCPVNSSIADGLDGLLPHLHARDVTLLLVSQAPLARLQAYKQRMGWSLPWVSRRTPTSTTTSAPPSPRSRCVHGAPTRAGCRRSSPRTRPRPDRHPRLPLRITGGERLHAAERRRLPDLCRPRPAGSSS